ncbi:MAG: cysteine peptidase family C39 domain-containing protein [Rikenellaceae bacterium]
MSKKRPFFHQLDSNTCGASCLKMICKYYGKSISYGVLVNKSHTSKVGSSLLNISDLAESIGFRTKGVQLSLEQLSDYEGLPCIAQFNVDHFIVIYEITKNNVVIADPAVGILKYHKNDFAKHWCYMKKNELDTGVLLLLEPYLHDKKSNTLNLYFDS